jgi:hypothetical protein
MKPMKKGGYKKAFSYSVFYEQAPEGGFLAFVPALPSRIAILRDANLSVDEFIELR